MSALAEILEKRAQLIAQAQAERQSLAKDIAGCRSAIAVADRGIAVARWLRARPYVVAIAAAAFMALRPKRALGWGARALSWWRIGWFVFKALQPALQKPAPGASRA
jgi:hypothetical protein